MAQATHDLVSSGGVSAQVEENPPLPPLLKAVAPSESTHERWLTYLRKEKGLAPNTTRLYGRTLEKAAQDLGPMENLDSETLRRWLHSQKGSHGTTANRLCALTSYYKYLVRTDVRPDCPTDKLDRPKARRGLPKPIIDVATALDALDRADERANLWSSDPRRVGETRDMAVFLIETGLRIHEAVNLNEPVPCGNTLRLRGKGSKDAIIPLTQKAQDALNRLGGRWPIGARATQRRFERGGFTPHQCRHTRGTSMAAAGRDLGDIQQMLRHSSPATTLVYTQWNTDRVRSAVEGIEY